MVSDTTELQRTVGNVRQWFYATYTVRWTGRRGPIAWPPRLPDLTPTDFFLSWEGECLKEHVYAGPPRFMKYLVARFK